ncbi:MAG: MFS transporter [Bacteroidetes bacterium]|nr:MAG: MFS transporter [Bacteroidota bacterium]RLD71353.1 MAG: MFS transporter [Bacteroidota bacterium]
MKRSFYLLILIFLVFFAISFLTNILGSINPNVTDSFKLSGTMTGMLPFSFFIAYAIMSIPSGMFVQKYGEKKSLILAWILAFAGALIFSSFPKFPVFLGSLFLIGSGMALLQVALYPLLRVVGGEEHFAFNSVIAQLVFGAASFLSPFVYSYLVTNLGNPASEGGFLIDLISKLTPLDLPWVSIYLVFSAVSFLMLLIILSTKFPAVVRKDDEVVGAWETHLQLFKNRTVILFFLGIFAYVGAEQGIANWISEFLRTYHGLTPEVEGARTVGMFWGLMTVGCVLGLGLLKIMDSKLVLGIFSSAALIILTFTLFGSVKMALFGFAALGFCLSVMYAIIFSLALNSVTKYHGSFAGILCTAIAGGAIFSLLIGRLKDMIGLQLGMVLLYLPLAYILSIAFWAKPIVSNATIRKTGDK